jgi:hypothetical protein
LTQVRLLLALSFQHRHQNQEREIMIKPIATAFAALLISVSAFAQTASVPVKDFDVYVDTPTGFVFVKLPTGWKFVARIDDADMNRLPGTVLTSLLAPDADGTVMARQGGEQAKP